MRAPTRNRTDTPRDAVAECIGIHPLDWHKDLPSTLTEPICNDTITWYAAGCAPILVNQYMRYHPDENKLKVAADAMWDALLKCYDPDVIAGIRTSFPAWMKMSIWGKVGRHNKLVSDRKGIVAKNALPQSTINAELSSLSTEGFDPLAGRHNESGGDLNIIALSGSGSQFLLGYN